MKYRDGSYYEGDWLNDLKHGQGLFFTAMKDKYEGYWFDD